MIKLKTIYNKIASLNIIDDLVLKSYELRENDISQVDTNFYIVVYFTYAFLVDSNHNIIKYKHFDTELWEIYKIQNKYFLIYGEESVFKLDSNLEIIFEVGAQDVLYNPNVKESFILHDNSFEIYDFIGNHIIYDFDGKIISKTC